MINRKRIDKTKNEHFVISKLSNTIVTYDNGNFITSI